MGLDLSGQKQVPLRELLAFFLRPRPEIFMTPLGFQMEPRAHFSADRWPKTYDNLLANCRVSHHSPYDAQVLRFMAQQNGASSGAAKWTP